jgi:phenylacetate-CoA ligase
MASLTNRLIERVKASPLVVQRVRYHSGHYDEVRGLLRNLDAMDREGRRALSLSLTERVLGWARQSAAGKGRGPALADWPIIDKSTLRSSYDLYARPEYSWLAAAAPGDLVAPVAVHRSVRSIAASQAFMDDLLAVWDVTFAGSRVVRLRGGDITPAGDDRPPYGAYRNRGRTLVLSPKHLSRATIRWFHDELERFQPDLLHTDAKLGAALTYFLTELGLTVKIPLILAVSRGFEARVRRALESTCNGTVIDYYRQSEGAAFAAGLAAGAYFFNPVYGRVELLAAPQLEAPAEHRAFEIVGTGFWNEALPLVRYRTGDVAIVPESYSASDLEDVALGLKPAAAVRHGALGGPAREQRIARPAYK